MPMAFCSRQASSTSTPRCPVCTRVGTSRSAWPSSLQLPRALKVILFAMPVLMAFAVVATANHYIVDVVAGVTLVMVGHAVALWPERRRELHREAL